MPGGVATRQANKILSDVDTVIPATDRTGYPWMLVGTAFDYRARLFFEPGFNFEKTVAFHLGPVFCRNTAELLRSAGESLTPDQRADDDYLARLCMIAAHLEGVSRSGGMIGTWLSEAELMAPEQVIERIPGEVVDDLTRLSQKLEAAFSDQMPDHIISNPTFGRIELNISADGDLILDGCLVDIKTTIDARVSREMLHQLVCYALLDHEDRFGIRNVGLYMARQGVLITWPLQELLLLLGGKNTDLEKLRAAFEEVAHQL